MTILRNVRTFGKSQLSWNGVDLWPSAPMHAVMTRIASNIPRAKGPQTYRFVVKPHLDRARYPTIITITPTGATFMGMGNKSADDAVNDWLVDHKKVLKVHSRDGVNTMTVAGGLVENEGGTQTFVPYYVVHDKHVYLDHMTIKSKMCGTDGVEAFEGGLAIFDQDVSVEVNVDPATLTFKAPQLVVPAGKTLQVYGFPVVLEEAREYVEWGRRLVSSLDHMRFQAFHLGL